MQLQTKKQALYFKEVIRLQNFTYRTLAKITDTADSEVNEAKALKAEIFRSQEQFKMERLCADVWDEIINVAESKFNITIRKKIGDKRDV